MKRRTFLGASTGTALAAIEGCKVVKINNAAKVSQAADKGIIAGKTLDELRKRYRYDLFDDFLAFLDKYVIDHEYGGFMCNTDRAGKNITTNKSAWYEGRGIWAYSFLYNRISHDPKHLEVARKSVEFILKNKPEGDNFWASGFTREGKPLKESGDIYGGLFIAEGLCEFSKAVKDESYWNLAKDILIRHLQRYDSPDYEYTVTYGPDIPTVKAPRVLGHWMVLIRLVTQMLEIKSDPELETIAGRCIEAIMKRHYNPSFGLMNEVLNHDFSRPTDGFGQFSYTGHAIETLWMVFFEAARRKDKALYEQAAEMFKRHIEIAWDDVYGGEFRCLVHVDDNIWKVDKVLWLQEEVLIGTLFMIENTGDRWAQDWFSKMYTYVLDKYPLKQYGYPLWIISADRKVTFEENATRVENFHHPRHLMLNLLALDRIIQRENKVSSLFS